MRQPFIAIALPTLQDGYDKRYKRATVLPLPTYLDLLTRTR